MAVTTESSPKLLTEGDFAGRHLLATTLAEIDNLTGMQRKFVARYLECWNATKAARDAGYKCPQQAGADCLKNPVIQQAIDEELSAWAIGAKETLAVLAEQARVNMGDFMDESGQIDVKKVKKLGQLVKKYKYKLLKTETKDDVTEQMFDVELELIDSQAALFFLGKHNKLVTSDDTNLAMIVYKVVVEVADAVLPKEEAGNFLGRISERLRMNRN